MPEPIILQNPHGELETIDAAEAKQALLPVDQGGGGYSMADPAAVHAADMQAKYGSTGQQAIGALEQGLSAATLGLSTGVEKNVLGVDPEDILGRKEALHPLVNMGAQTLGLILPNLIPGVGEAADVKAALGGAKEANQLLKAGEITAADAAPFLEAGKKAAETINPLSASSIMSGTAERVANSMGFQGDIGKSAAKMAIESAIFQGGNETSDMFANDPDQSIGTAATDIGLAGLIGLPLGAAGGAASSLIENSKVGKNLSNFIGDFKGRIKEHLENPNPLKNLAEELSNHLNIDEEGLDVYGKTGLKAEAIQKLMPNQLSDHMVEQAENFMAKGKALIQNMKADPDLYPRGLAARFEKEFNTYANSMSESAAPQELFSNANDLKQRLQGLVKYQKDFMGNEMVPKMEETFVNDVKKLAYEVRTGLEDVKTWGKAAEVQQTINSALHEYLPALKDFRSKFTTKVGGVPQLDEGKLQTYLNQTGKAGQKIKQEMLGNFIDASEKFRSVVGEVSQKIGSESLLPDSSLSYTKSTLNQLTPGAKVADALVKKGLSRLGGEALGAGIGGTAGHFLGSAGFGALIGEHMMGPFFSSILPSLIKPMLEKQASSSGLKAAIDMGLSVMKGESIINRASSSLFKASSEVLPSNLIPTARERKSLNKSIEAYQKDPQTMFNMDKGEGHYLPGHAVSKSQLAINSVNTLGALKPKPSKNSPLDSEPEVPQAQKAEYERALNIAQQPLMVLQHIKDGTLQLSDVKLMHQLYPALYQKLVLKLNDEMTNHLAKGDMVPYKTRMGLSLFMGQPLDSTMSPLGIQQAQMANNVTGAQNQANDAKLSNHSSLNGLEKMGKSNMTASQSREMDRLK